MAKWQFISEGKVRKKFVNEPRTRVALVAGDGVSAFDSSLGVSFSGKGKILTQISKYWFDQTADIVPNAYTPVKKYADQEFAKEHGDAVTEMICLRMIPVEAIVRGYIAGSAWEEYSAGARTISGVQLPDGLRESERLSVPIFTPLIKATRGEHDRPISFDEMIDYLDKNHFLMAHERSEIIRDYSFKLYDFASYQLFHKGIILADAKFEFGINPDTGSILLADEVITPDSARFWSVQDYETGKPQKSLDKQSIRDWVKAHPGETIPKEVLEEASAKYARICDIITQG